MVVAAVVVDAVAQLRPGEILRFFVAVEKLPPAVEVDRLKCFVAVEPQAPYNVVQPEPEQALDITVSFVSVKSNLIKVMAQHCLKIP